MYIVRLSTRAQKSLRRYGHSGSFPQEIFEKGLYFLKEGKTLPHSFRDHALKGNLSAYREFHVAANILVQYEVDTSEQIIVIRKVGTHTELFGT